MTKQRLPKSAAIGIIVAILLVVSAGAYFLLVSPQRSKSAELAQEIEATAAEVQAARIAQRQALQAEPIRVADLFRVAKAMPDTEDMPGVLLELNRIARETGIQFESLTSAQDATDAGGYLRQPIEVVFDGNFYELSDFLYRVRSLVSVHGGKLDATGRLFTVRSLGFVESEAGFPLIRATLSLDAYVYGTGVATTQPGAPVSPAPAATPPAAPQPAPQPAPPASASAVGAN